jgi:hypothetical protein
MHFNPRKCQVLNITRNKHKIKHNYILHGHIIETVPSAKYLGVDLSEDLSFNTHINRICTTANRTLGFVKRNIQTQNKKVKETAYKTLVRPQVEYSSPVWSPYTKQNINKIEMVQRRAIRWIHNNYSTYDSVSDMQQSLGIRSLENRRTDAKIVLFYKIVHSLVAVPIPTYLEKPRRLTRHTHLLAYRQIHTVANYYKFSYFPCTVVLWNSLPSYIVLLPTLESFKLAVSQISYN